MTTALYGSYEKKHKLTLLLDFLLVILIFVVFLIGVLVYSFNLSKKSGRDVTRMPQQVFPANR